MHQLFSEARPSRGVPYEYLTHNAILSNRATRWPNIHLAKNKQAAGRGNHNTATTRKKNRRGEGRREGNITTQPFCQPYDRPLPKRAAAAAAAQAAAGAQLLRYIFFWPKKCNPQPSDGSNAKTLNHQTARKLPKQKNKIQMLSSHLFCINRRRSHEMKNVLTKSFQHQHQHQADH